MSTLVPGATFGSFEIVSELGRGGMGCVYKARDTTLDRPVALKVLADELSADDSFLQRFMREARAAARLNHPNIVQIYGFGKTGAISWLSMEFVDGLPVGAYLRSGHVFPESAAISIGRHAARALAVAHAAGIVHRDVKPDNLILSRKGEVKLVDLGLAKCAEDDAGLTQPGYAMGTPHYIAPEQVRGQRDIDGRADIYSLGASLYHVATGRTPYEGDSGPLVMSQHLVEPLPDPRNHRPALSDGFCSLIVRMMAKERDARFPDMASVDRALAELQEDLATPRPAPPPPAGYRSGPPEPPRASVRGTSFTAAETFAAGGTPSTGYPAAAVDAEQLRKVELELARHIGPLAKVLVKRAAKSAASLEVLTATLAENVPDPRARKAFLDAVKRHG